MGDEQRPAAAEPASAPTSSSTSSSDARSWGRRNPIPIRTETVVTGAGGDDDGQAKAPELAAESGTRPEGESARLDDGTEADAAADLVDDTEAEAAGTAEAQGPLTLDQIEGHVLRQIRYHEARARFLDFWRRVFDFLVVLFGAGAVSTATQASPFWTAVLGVALAAIGALQLVAGFSEKAGEHTALKRRFCGVLADITEARGEADPDRRLAKITKKWAAIWADEPPTLHVLEAIAWNATRRTREYDLDDSTLIEIPRWESLTRNLSSWESFEPLTRAERAARRGQTSGGLAWWQRARA